MESVIAIIAIVIVLILIIGLSIVLSKAKKEYKKDGYRLLKNPNPNPKDIKVTINALNRYVGRWSKDEEAAQLINRLMDKLTEISE